MKIQLTYHIAGTNPMYTPIDYKVSANIDTTISNSLPCNTTYALNNFIKPIEISKILDEIQYILNTKKLNNKNTKLIVKNIDMYIITISAKAVY